MHGQLQARTSQGRTAAANKPAGSSSRKGRSQDTVWEAMRIEDAYEDKREDNEPVPVVFSMRTMTAVNPCQQFHVDADASEPNAWMGTRRSSGEARFTV